MHAETVIGLLITTAAAIAALLAAWWAGHQALSASGQAHTAKDQLALAHQAHQDQVQPYVFADIRPDEAGYLMMLIVENTGPTVARNIRLQFDPPLRSIAFPEVQDLEMLRSGIPALPPGRRIVWYFDTGPDIFQNDVPKRYAVTVDGSGPFGPMETLQYELDFSILENSEARDRGSLKQVVDQLKQIDKRLVSIDKRLDVRTLRARNVDAPAAEPPSRSAPDDQ